MSKKMCMATRRMEPEEILCPLYDHMSINTFPLPDLGEMGLRVLDNECEEHIQ